MTGPLGYDFIRYPALQRRPLTQMAAPPSPAQNPQPNAPLGPQTSDYAQGLADALDRLNGAAPRSMPALGENLFAQALLRLAQRNGREGQADPLAWVGGGGGGFGPAPASGASTPQVLPPRQIPLPSAAAPVPNAAAPNPPFAKPSAPQINLPYGAGSFGAVY